MSEEDNFDEDDVVVKKCIGCSGVEEKSSDDEITLTNYIHGSIPKPLTGSVKSEDRSGAGFIKSEDRSGAGSIKSEDRSGEFYY